MKKNLKKGFTLIELLVVIAIIGILSGIVLASLNTARTKGNDAKVQAQLASIRADAEITYSNTGTAYGTALPGDVDCPATTGSISASSNFVTTKTNMPTGTIMRCGVTATTFAKYAAAASLAGGATGDYWCVDSSGAAGKINITTPANVVVSDDTCALMEQR